MSIRGHLASAAVLTHACFHLACDGMAWRGRIPLVADPTKEISADYGVLIPSLGIALRGLFIINPEGILEQVIRVAGQLCVVRGWWAVSRCVVGVAWAGSAALFPRFKMALR